MKFDNTIKRTPIVETIEHITLFVLVLILLALLICPHALHRAYLNTRTTIDDNYTLLSEEVNLYSNADLTEDEISFYTTYFEEELPELPLYNNDYDIILTNDKLYSINPYTVMYNMKGYYITALTNATYKYITIDIDYLNMSFYHEIGHAVDNTYSFSETPEFQELYDQVEHDTYLTGDIMEYFADGYSRFLRGRFDPEEDTELIEYYESILYLEYPRNK